MTALSDLRRARLVQGLSLARLAERVGVTRANLSTLLNGRRDPRLSSVERVARGLGAAVLVAPLGGRATVAELVDRIAGDVRESDASGAYRSWIQIADDLTAEPFTRALLAAQEPGRIDSRWDAAIAGLVQWRLEQVGIPAPSWALSRPGDPTDRWRPPAEFASKHLPDTADVPDALRERGIWIDAAELESA